MCTRLDQFIVMHAFHTELGDCPKLGQVGGDVALPSRVHTRTPSTSPATWALQPSAFGSTIQPSSGPSGRPLVASIGGVNDGTADQDAPVVSCRQRALIGH
jgi:hypothetical protein